MVKFPAKLSFFSLLSTLLPLNRTQCPELKSNALYGCTLVSQKLLLSML